MTNQNRAVRIAIIFCTLIWSVGCGSSEVRPRPYDAQRVIPNEASTSVSDFGRGGQLQISGRDKSLHAAPWEVTTNIPVPIIIEEAERAEREKEVLTALQRYDQARKSAMDLTTRQLALERQASLLLKYGRSKEALQVISTFAATEGIAIDQLPASTALLIAFAYQHQRDIDQTFAWLSTAERRALSTPSSNDSTIAERARSEAARLVQNIRDDAFEGYARRWNGDRLISSLFSAERGRRARGEIARHSVEANWFSPELYGLPPVLNLPSDFGEEIRHSSNPLLEEDGSDQKALGAILPLSGPYAAHAENVRRGIELALTEQIANLSEQMASTGLPPALSGPIDLTPSSTSAGEWKLIFADNGGDSIRAGDEYVRLANQEGVDFVLGPLLVRSAEEVAQRSINVGVPFLTFTKREGITRLSRYALRLGATADNQVEEVLYLLNSSGFDVFGRFGARARGLSPQEPSLPNSAPIGNRVMLIGTAKSNEEFESAFRSSAEGASALAGSLVVSSNDLNSAMVVLDQIRQVRPQALFFPDSPADISVILDQLRRSDLATIPWIGSASWGDPIVLRSMGRLLDGAYYVSPYFAQSSRPVVVRFRESYRAKFGVEPDLLAAQAYDATMLAKLILNDRISQAPSQNQNVVDQAVVIRRPRTMDGVTGALEIRSSGEISRRLSVIGIQGGEGIELTASGIPTGATLAIPPRR